MIETRQSLKRGSGRGPRRDKSSGNLRPSRQELLEAVRNTVPDLIGYDLRVLFCGINPGLYSAWARHHFARPGNRFWPALFASGFTKTLLRPERERELLSGKCGITNLVERPTVGSQELSREELRAGGREFEIKTKKFRPYAVAILGVSAYRAAYDKPEARVGMQPERIGGALVWVLPNPSGLNAHYTPPALAKVFSELRFAVWRG
jgi:double-stranded uracil-DNA glycosylase